MIDDQTIEGFIRAAILGLVFGIITMSFGAFEVGAACFGCTGVLGTIVINEQERRAMKRNLGRRK